jgi:hypothetical protein
MDDFEESISTSNSVNENNFLSIKILKKQKNGFSSF